jgi:hypothetical protein
MKADPRMDGMADTLSNLPQATREWLANVKPAPNYSGPQSGHDPQPVIEKYRLRTADQIVDHYVNRLLQMRIPKERRGALMGTLTAGGPLNPESPDGIARTRQMIRLLVSMPEYQVN